MNRALVLGMVLLGALFGAGGMWLANRIAPAELGATDKVRIERTVRDYILANPEILPEAMQRLEQRNSAKAVAASRGAIETPYGSAVAGNPDGDVTVVQFFDYNCGYCRAALPTITALVKADPNVRVVFRELPILADSSRDAALASLAAAQQGRFAAFHDALYRGGPVTAASISGAAKATGVDASKIPDDAAEELGRNLRTAQSLGLTGTPSWVIGDQVLSGALPLDRLQEAVAKARRS